MYGLKYIMVNNDTEKDLVHRVLSYSSCGVSSIMMSSVEEVVRDNLDATELKNMLIFDYSKYLSNLCIKNKYMFSPNVDEVDFSVWADILANKEYNTYRDITKDVLIYDNVREYSAVPINIIDTEIEGNISHYLSMLKRNNDIYNILKEVLSV